MVTKKCPSCAFECDIGIAKDYFHKDKNRSSGYTSKCKKCKYKYDLARSKHNRYRDFDAHIKNKHLLRSRAKKMRKEIDFCSVIGCKESPELHHIDYKSNDSIVPLCRDHHSKIHSLEYQLELFLSDHSIMIDDIKLKDARIKELEEQVNGKINQDTSDGYHTFRELHHHRLILTKSLFNLYPSSCLKSKLHDDGTMFDNYFIVGFKTDYGIASYHYHIDHWGSFLCEEVDRFPKWDGHTSDDAINRIDRHFNRYESVSK